jgi:hypothetical protein
VLKNAAEQFGESDDDQDIDDPEQLGVLPGQRSKRTDDRDRNTQRHPEQWPDDRKQPVLTQNDSTPKAAVPLSG